MNLKIQFLFILFIFLSSCSSSRVGIGRSYDKGNLVRGGKDDKGGGFFANYSWQKKKEIHSYGIDLNVHVAGYSGSCNGCGDSMPFLNTSLLGKYYYPILGSPIDTDRYINIDAGAGLGLGLIGDGGDMKGASISSLSLNIHFQKNRFIYLAPQVNYIQKLDDGTNGFSYGIGIGFQLRK